MFAAFLKGIVLGFTLAISVGPVIFAILKQSLINGRKGGYSFVAGIAISDIILVLLANLASDTFNKLMNFKNEIGTAGSILLICIGIYFLVFKKVAKNFNPDVPVELNKGHYFKIFLSGFFVNILNPILLLFWFTWATAFIDHSVSERVVLFSTCLLFVLVTDLLKVILANKIREKLTSKIMIYVNRLSGLIFLGFGLVLLILILFFNKK
jgi:threonine/homoserine/homoserine lactone efflux protein